MLPDNDDGRSPPSSGFIASPLQLHDIGKESERQRICGGVVIKSIINSTVILSRFKLYD